MALLLPIQPARAESTAISYSLAGTGTVVGGTDTTLTLDAQASGSVLSNDPSLDLNWNPISYSDQSTLDLTTNLLNGNFVMTFADGDTLAGTVFEDDTAIDSSPTQTGSFPQTLTFTGGTGAFANASGSVSGTGYLGPAIFAVSGSGTIDTAPVPEPSPGMLLLSGLVVLVLCCRTTKLLRRRNLLVHAAGVCVMLPTFRANADPLAYVETSNQNGSYLGSMDLATGAFQQIGPGLSDLGEGLAPLNGTLYSLGFDGVLNAINPETGIQTLIGKGLGDCSVPGVSACGLNSASGFGVLSGTLYATDFANNLYTLDASTGRATLIGSTGMPKVTFVPSLPSSNGTWTGVDESLFTAGGKLYANEDFVTIDPTSPTPVVGVVLADALYQINTSTGQATQIAPTLTPLNAFVNVDGTEYGFDGNLGEVVSLDLSNGSSTFVSNYDPSAGIISGAAAAPEPVSASLACAGVVAFALLRWIGWRRREASSARNGISRACLPRVIASARNPVVISPGEVRGHYLRVPRFA